MNQTVRISGSLLGYFVGLFVLLILFLYGLGNAWWPLVLSGGLAYLFAPFISFCERIVGNRIVVVLCLLLILIGGVLCAVSFLVPWMIQELQHLLRVLPSKLDQVLSMLDNLAQHYGIMLPFSGQSLHDLVQQRATSSFSADMMQPLRMVLDSIFSGIVSGILRLVNIALFPVFFFFVLSNYSAYTQMFYNFFPHSWHGGLREYIAKVDQILSIYIRGQLLLALIMAVYYSTALALVGLPFGWVIGLVTGALSVVPYLGVSIGVLGTAVMIVTNFTGWLLVGMVVMVFVVGQLLEGWGITPRLVGKHVGLNTLAIFLALIVGGNLFGLLGMIVAIPFAGIVKMSWFELRKYQIIPPNV